MKQDPAGSTQNCWFDLTRAQNRVVSARTGQIYQTWVRTGQSQPGVTRFGQIQWLQTGKGMAGLDWLCGQKWSEDSAK